MFKDYKIEKKKPLALHEYGRNVQHMVDYCITIEDRAERQRCAETIIQTMNSFSLKSREREDYWPVLWDHLYIMSDFQLDVDFPYPVTSKEEFYNQKIETTLKADHQKQPKYKQYGRNVERMIAITLTKPEGEERFELAKLTAQQMKRDYLAWNKDNVENSRIFQDLYEMSEGQIYLDEMTCQLPDASDLTGQGNSGQQNKRHLNFKKKR